MKWGELYEKRCQVLKLCSTITCIERALWKKKKRERTSSNLRFLELNMRNLLHQSSACLYVQVIRSCHKFSENIKQYI
jgi:hypothetical protein